MKNTSQQRGQALIILVLMISIILAIVSATSYRLTTETQTTESQEESVRALAAADAGIEVGLQRAYNAASQPMQIHKYSDLPLILPGIDTEKSRVIITNTTPDFVSPVIPKDGQFTFYVKDYNNAAAVNYASDINIHFHSELGNGCGNPRTQAAYEITYIYGPTRNLVRRALIEPCTGANAIQGNSFTTPTNGSFTVRSTNFEHRITINPATSGMTDMSIIIIRTVFGSARFGFTGTNLLSQGKDIKAEAYTVSGPSKIVTVFQSLPQIPAEFFVTSF